MANVEESKPSNQDKIILYHGETYGSWIYQMVLKEFLFPNAPEDWLPLRFDVLDSDIDKTTLLKLIKHKATDQQEIYRQLGLSVSPNLYSEWISESAWGNICQWRFTDWQKITGFGDINMHHQLYGELREKFIPRERWPKFKMQK